MAEGNSADTSPDGVLFSADGKQLVLYPPGRKAAHYAIPDGVESIGVLAFGFCAALEEVEIPEGVTNIGVNAFYRSGLTSVTTPKSVLRIEHGAFSSCSNLAAATIAAGQVGHEALPWEPDYHDNVFEYCTALEAVTLGPGVTEVAQFAFTWSAVRTLYVPASWEGDANSPVAHAFYNETAPREDPTHPIEIVYRDAHAEEVTQTTPVPVPLAWLEEEAADILTANGGDHEAAAKAPAANGRPVWECYVADVSLTDATEDFKTVLAWENGQWVPKPSPDRGETRAYTIQGASELGDEDTWGPVTDESRFFRVKVGLPK